MRLFSLPALLVVTDLDGSLLDHHSYSFAAALPALKRLEQKQIPLVLCSSKTRAEIELFRNAIGNDQPFIVENGSAIYYPSVPSGGREGYQLESFGMNRADIIRQAHLLRQQYHLRFRGFADMTPEDLMAVSELDHNMASLALQREFTEPLLWEDSEAKLELFQRDLAAEGIQSVRGGRFLHLSGTADKGMAVSRLKQYYMEKLEHVPTVIALGDSENDLGMLACADYAVLIRSPVKTFPEFTHAALLRTRAEGPAGWNEAMMSLLDELVPEDEDGIL